MKNTNPINSLNLKLERYRKELSDLQETYLNLKTQHSNLVKESVKLERNFDKIETAIENMCDGCAAKNTDTCQNCELHNVAIEFDLWR